MNKSTVSEPINPSTLKALRANPTNVIAAGDFLRSQGLDPVKLFDVFAKDAARRARRERRLAQ